MSNLKEQDTNGMTLENSSDSVKDVHPYEPEPIQDSDVEEQGSGHHGSRASDLLRTVTQYTEYSVASGGAAAEEAEKEQEESDEKKTGGAHIGKPEKNVPGRYGFWSKPNGTLRKIFFKQWTIIIVILSAYVLGVFSIYWGSMYQRPGRLVNLKVLVVVEDDQSAILSNALLEALENPAVKSMVGWTVKDYMPEDQVKQLINTEKYWGSIYVGGPNVSTELVSAFQESKNINTSDLMKSYYETARDLMGVSLYIKPALIQAGSVYNEILQQSVYPGLISNLSSSQFSAMKGSPILTNIPDIQYTDGNPVTSPVLLAPLQVGLIYMIILSFFQILWFVKLNGDVAKYLKPINYIVYRMVLEQVNCLLLSLAYTLLNRAFQIDMNRTWSGGFGVMWMISYLIMAACGGANENIFLLTGPILPPLVGFWILFFVVLNVSATFSPVEVCPEVFKFTYALPIKNGYELMKITLLDTYKGHLGRYFGVLVAWVVLNNILMPFCLIFFASMTKKKIRQQEQARRAAEAAKKNVD
ncbi:DEKNAAC102545 [Brettanomyces naardenensis]|uniref:DEKNAAC102545 n=1 Tax=Brettanomyces naardenensis TaxID=13370 RepID=A0A448YKC7_BRENA|nr:DEKNAAC102545 [Brettanomyces naardenensis]